MGNNILIMPFLDNSESFCYGFECGILWCRMNNNDVFEQALIHSSNVAQVRLMAEHHGYDYSISEAGEGWAYLSGKPVDISQALTGYSR
jgi:hypothetical protein